MWSVDGQLEAAAYRLGVIEQVAGGPMPAGGAAARVPASEIHRYGWRPTLHLSWWQTGPRTNRIEQHPPQ